MMPVRQGRFLPKLTAAFAAWVISLGCTPSGHEAFTALAQALLSWFRMNVSLYQAAAALSANSQWQDVISENLSSSSVPGFRKQSLATAAVQAGLMPLGGLNGTGATGQFTIPKSTTSVSFKHGEMDYMGESKDAAIEGEGFFQVQLPDGTTAVTRDGEFQVNSKGQLVTKEGYAVLSQNDSPIKLDTANHDPLFISPTGDVSQGGAIKGKIGLTDFTNPQLLTQTNGVYFLVTNPALVTQPATGTIRDGYVESGNTSALGEMANMMTALRTFEANQNVIQMQDDRLGKTITELGNPT
jgi:flagellar basal-body rod protein FlgG